jgi:hypothetical protein
VWLWQFWQCREEVELDRDQEGLLILGEAAMPRNCVTASVPIWVTHCQQTVGSGQRCCFVQLRGPIRRAPLPWSLGSLAGQRCTDVWSRSETSLTW